MTDTHTHILPGMDDGAQDLKESLSMLRMCRKQGVDTVILTPHFYPDRESLERFLQRRDQAFRQLQAALPSQAPRLVLGAEVAWFPGIERMQQIRQLCIGDTRYLLLELPYEAWTDAQLNSVWELAANGAVIPVLAHVERYLHLQRHGQMQALMDMQLPMQLSAGIFSKFFGRKKALKLMQRGQWMIGSDCHNLTNRLPCMDIAACYLQQRCPQLEPALNWNFD